MPLFVGNDSNLEVLGLVDEEAAFVTNAAITCLVTDSSGATMGSGPITLTYRGAGVAVTVGGVTYKDGNYRGTLAGNISPPLVAGTTYKLHYAASNYNMPIDRYEVAQARLG